MMDAAIMVATARGTPIRVIAVAANAVWRDGFIIFVPTYLRQDLVAIGGGASSVAHHAKRMKKRELEIAMMNLMFDSRYRAGTISGRKFSRVSALRRALPRSRRDARQCAPPLPCPAR